MLVGAALALGAPASAEETSTYQLASFLFESLGTEAEVVVPPELNRRVGELQRMAVDLDPHNRVLGSFALVSLKRGELLTLTAFEPPEGVPPVELAMAAFARCAVRSRCPEAVKFLRQIGGKKAKKGKGRLETPEAVMLLSLVAQRGFIRWVEKLGVKHAGQREMLEVAKRRHLLLFGAAVAPGAGEAEGDEAPRGTERR